MDDARVLLRKAMEDRHLMLILDSQAEGTDEQYGFACQQAIEKALKAVLAFKEVSYPWTHDLTRLLLLLDSSGIEAPADLAEVDRFTAFAVRFRYESLPDEGEGVGGFDRQGAARLAGLAVEWAAAVIGSEGERTPSSG